ncbi:hypothetical protein SAMN05443292_1592 [Halpernia frigidisoli]|uniref:Uncharacterized protein n=1 Tax=Halpernia frigidisoli TaxID=1125876 RepID=A0A1I3FS59_9FLAO|nr:hypothetical protein SAMN05443292_1592 [Halpernia frigidisoli]
MTTRNKILLLSSIFASIIGVLLKLNQYKFFGNVFIAIGTLIWFYLIALVIYKYLKTT